MADDNLVCALARAQAKFPPIVKSHTNPAFKGSQYADVADVLAAVRPVLAAEGLIVSQATAVLDDGSVVLVTSVCQGETNEAIRSMFPLAVHGLTAQQVGSLLTYHRRYQLCALLGVHPVGDDDDGNLAASAPAYVAPARVEPIAPVDLDKPLVSMSIPELRSAAQQLGHDFGKGAITKAEMVRQLDPLVRAKDGAEPFFDIDSDPQPGSAPPTPPSGSERKAVNSAMKAPDA